MLHPVKCIYQATKEDLREKILSNKTKTNYYWNEKIGQLVNEKKVFEMISFKDLQDRIEFKRLQGRIRKMVTE